MTTTSDENVGRGARERPHEHARRMEALGRLAGGIAHDFNNLLTSIRGLGALALEELEPGHPLRPDLEEILKAAHRATEMTGDLLAFSGRQRMETAAVDVSALVEDVARRMRARDPMIDVRLAPDRSTPLVAADPQKLGLALENIVLSAARASTATPVHIETGLARLEHDEIPQLAPGDYAVVRISDNGSLTGEQLDAVFEPFAAPRSTEKGYGLALSVAYGIIRRAGGLVHATSSDSGVTMTAFLPLAPVEPASRHA
jgi:two-component system, cell cycle sensor histidine kinase and response regulator CckA